MTSRLARAHCRYNGIDFHFGLPRLGRGIKQLSNISLPRAHTSRVCARPRSHPIYCRDEPRTSWPWSAAFHSNADGPILYRTINSLRIDRVLLGLVARAGAFVGMFVCKISEGRTVRELIGGMLVGSLGCALFFMILGNFT